MKFALSLLSLVVALNTTSVTFAADRVVQREDGSFVNLDAIDAEQSAANLTSEIINGLSTPTVESSACTILSHTNYSAPNGSACVRCGGSLVMVYWMTGNGHMYIFGHSVSACPRTLDGSEVQVGNGGVLIKTIQLKPLKDNP